MNASLPTGTLRPDPGALVLLDAVPGIVVLVDVAGDVVWVSSAAAEMTGYTPEELVGTNILQHIDTTWNPRTLDSIGHAVANPGRRLPTLLRFFDKRGDGLVLEAQAHNLYDDPQVGALVVHLRDCNEQQLLEEILEAVARGEELGDVLHMVHAAVAGDAMRADSALVARSPGVAHQAGRVLTWDDQVHSLTTLADPESPWEQAAATGEAVIALSLDALPPAIAAPAAAAGYRACWAFPARRANADVAAVLVAWRREDGPPEPNAFILAERLVRLLGLAIERVEHVDQLRHAADHDGLTGLANRARFFTTVDRHLRHDRGPVGVAYLDLDGFKPVNDQHGHAAGDAVLRVVGDRLRACTRAQDEPGRLGGDEFAVCCPGASLLDLVGLAERILAAMAEPVVVDGRPLQVGASIGLAAAPARSCAADVLVGAADTALLSAKSSCKGSWQASSVHTA